MPNRRLLLLLLGADLFIFFKDVFVFLGLGVKLLHHAFGFGKGKFFGVSAEDDIGSAARHVRGDRDRALSARLSDDIGLLHVEFRIEDVVFDALFGEEFAETFGLFDRNGTDQNRLAFRVFLEDLFDDAFSFAFRFIDWTLA